MNPWTNLPQILVKELSINHGSVHCAWFEDSKTVNHLKLLKNYLNPSLSNKEIKIRQKVFSDNNSFRHVTEGKITCHEKIF